MKISYWQIFWICIFTGYAYYSINPSFLYAKQDAWISMILASTITIVFTYLFSKLSLLYPDKTIVEYSQEILGKWLGILVLLPYFFTWYIFILSFLRDFTGFVNIAILEKTPIIAIYLVMIVLIAYLLFKGGLKGIGRFAELVGPLFLLITFGLLCLKFNSFDWKQILPVYVDSGWNNILKGAFTSATFLIRMAFLPLMFVAFLSNKKTGVKAILGGTGLISISLILYTIVCLFLFGPKINN